MSTITPSQTVGLFFAYGLTPNGRYAWNDVASNDLVTPDIVENRIRIEGALYDGDDAPVPDGMVEIWQADGRGRFPSGWDTGVGLSHTAFKGFGRCATSSDGEFVFSTVKPGATEDLAGGRQAPHIRVAGGWRDVDVFCRACIPVRGFNAATWRSPLTCPCWRVQWRASATKR